MSDVQVKLPWSWRFLGIVGAIVVAGGLLCVGVLGVVTIFKSPPTPFVPPAAVVPPLIQHENDGFTHFSKLDDFVGVDCYLIPFQKASPTGRLHDEKFGAEEKDDGSLPMVGGGRIAIPGNNAREFIVHVEKVADGKMYFRIGKDLAIYRDTVRPDLCPVTDAKKMASDFTGKNFTFGGTTIGSEEVEAGSRIKVVRVWPGDMGYNFSIGFGFNATVILPKGTEQEILISAGDHSEFKPAK